MQHQWTNAVESIEAQMVKLRHLIAIRERAEASGLFRWAQGGQKEAEQTSELGVTSVAGVVAEEVKVEPGSSADKEGDPAKEPPQDQSSKSSKK